MVRISLSRVCRTLMSCLNGYRLKEWATEWWKKRTFFSLNVFSFEWSLNLLAKHSRPCDMWSHMDSLNLISCDIIFPHYLASHTWELTDHFPNRPGQMDDFMALFLLLGIIYYTGVHYSIISSSNWNPIHPSQSSSNPIFPWSTESE